MVNRRGQTDTLHSHAYESAVCVCVCACAFGLKYTMSFLSQN